MHKAGFVNLVGNPNVGKSTLMNLLVGERISIATFKAQTTRHRIMGILNTDDMQIVFSDTPGVLKPNYKLQESMLNFSESALADDGLRIYTDDFAVGEGEMNLLAYLHVLLVELADRIFGSAIGVVERTEIRKRPRSDQHAARVL